MLRQFREYEVAMEILNMKYCYKSKGCFIDSHWLLAHVKVTATTWRTKEEKKYFLEVENWHIHKDKIVKKEAKINTVSTLRVY